MKRGADISANDLHTSLSSSKSTRDAHYRDPYALAHVYFTDYYRSEVYIQSVINNLSNAHLAAQALFNEANLGHEEVVRAILGYFEGYLHLLPNGPLCWALQASVNNATHGMTQALLQHCTPFLFRDQVKRIYQNFSTQENTDANTDALFQSSIVYLSQRPREV